MRVAAIQMEIEIGAVEENRRRAGQLLRQAAAEGGKLALLPELWPSGFALDKLGQLAETMRGGSIGLLRQLARELQIFIVGGSIAEKKDGRFYNTSVAINEAGEICAKYRKAHLYPHGLQEHKYFSQGDEWQLTPTGDFALGLQICYDLFFPEFTRNLCLRGAQLLTVPVACSAGPLEEFQALARARALENQCFVILANQADIGASLSAEQSMAGGSQIISPQGKILAQAPKAEAIIWADLNLNELQQLRGQRNYLNDRRNILDEIDNSQL